MTKVDDFIKQGDIVMFSKSYCPYCKTAKDILKDYGKLNVMEIDSFNNDEVLHTAFYF